MRAIRFATAAFAIGAIISGPVSAQDVRGPSSAEPERVPPVRGGNNRATAGDIDLRHQRAVVIEDRIAAEERGKYYRFESGDYRKGFDIGLHVEVRGDVSVTIYDEDGHKLGQGTQAHLTRLPRSHIFIIVQNTEKTAATYTLTVALK
jgi:hypothetical protein